VKVVCLICLAAFGAADALLAAAEGERDRVPTNFEIIERVSSAAADELAAGIDSIPANSIVLLSKTKGAGDADFLLENALVRRMTSAGIRVTIEEPKQAGSAADTSGGYRFSYHVVRLKIAYPKISRKWLHG